TSETKSARTTASSCSNSTANNTCTPAPIETTAMSTINRSEHHNLKGPKRALSYPNDLSPHYVWFFIASNTSSGDSKKFRVIHVIFRPSAPFHPGVQVCGMFVSVVLCAAKAQRLYHQKGIGKGADVALGKNAQILLPLGSDEFEMRWARLRA